MENKYIIAIYSLSEEDVIKIKKHLSENFELMEIEALTEEKDIFDGKTKIKEYKKTD